MTTADLLRWLKEPRDAALSELSREADAVRHAFVGDEVHLRGLVEISNHCLRQCYYCGLRAGNHGLTRYRMTMEEIVGCARAAHGYGYGTVVLQAGEDPGITQTWMVALIQQIKQETGLAVTLSLGERNLEELGAWRAAGADRYLLRFETSNANLFKKYHPGRAGKPTASRIRLLKELRQLGYEVGSGIMIGLPGQTYQDLVNDLELFRQMDLDMIGVGPLITHPATPLAECETNRESASEQVPNTELMTYKMIALTRLVCPHANLPSTTALATLNLAEGRELGLQRGANILMPNLTPPPYRLHYEIYPAKACLRESAEQCHACISRRIGSLGRSIGRGPGGATPRGPKCT